VCCNHVLRPALAVTLVCNGQGNVEITDRQLSCIRCRLTCITAVAATTLHYSKCRNMLMRAVFFETVVVAELRFES